jgi:hypothetical protein
MHMSPRYQRHSFNRRASSLQSLSVGFTPATKLENAVWRMDLEFEFRLEAYVAYVGLAGEVELSLEVKTCFVPCVADVQYEGDFFQARFCDTRDATGNS